MTIMRWPDDYTAAVVRKYSPGMLADLAAWLISLAARLADALMRPAVLAAVPQVPRPAAAVAFARGPRVVWSAPAGADSMTTGPPGRAGETSYGAGRT
jgi:hypothetical protein